MRSHFILCLALFACNTSTAAPPSAGTASPPPAVVNDVAPILVPGRSIGPIHLDMSRGDVASLGLEIRPHPSGQFSDSVRMVGPYYVVFGDDDLVDSIELNLSSSGTGIRVGSALIAATSSQKQAAAIVPRCGEVEMRLGGNLVRCDGRTLIKVGSMSPDVVEIQVIRHEFR